MWEASKLSTSSDISLTQFELREGESVAQSNIWLPFAVVATLSLLILNSISQDLTVWASIILFMLGVPHGAIERTQKAPRFIMPTLSYTALYLVFGILVFSSWLISPLGTFVLFLLLSAWHFGEAEPDLKSLGLWVIIGSCLLYPLETLSIFAVLVGTETVPAVLVLGTQIFASSLLVFIALEYFLRQKQGHSTNLLRATSIIALLLILPPIPAVAVYFFAFHGMGEFVRTLSSVSRAKSGLSYLDILKLYGPATIPAMVGAVGIIILTYNGMIAIPIAAGLGVAFIIPHMLPVENLLRVERGETD